MNFISISTFLISFVFFLLLFILQVLVWRFFKPSRQMLLLFCIYLLVPAVFLAGTLLVGSLQGYIPSGVLLLSIAVVYVQTFPALQAISPSLELIDVVKSIEASGGASEDDIFKAMNVDSLLTDRMEDLTKDGLATVDARNELRLTASGLILAKLFYFYRKILGLPRGEG